MSPSTPIRLATLVLMLLVLTFVTIRVVGGQKSRSSTSMDATVSLREFTIPVEIIETGEDPATVEVRVQP